ncbi:MAG TPA: RNA methyltransferase [Anaerolineae bacterium]|nr:RNA methyltransferase [Anaerolineae bacterium]HRJ58845.1 TfoX/Sxy family protein [Anaerolineales bacterium]
MAYNLKLAERIRAVVKGWPIIEKKMFGGVGYMLHGNMACGILGDDLIVRVHLEDYEKLLKRTHVKIFTMKNGPRPMKGWLMVEPEGYKTGKQLSSWVKMGMDFASALPPK